MPSIKATIFQPVSDEITRLIESGRLTRTSLAQRLESSDQLYLGKQLAASSWVPVATHVRVLAILIELDAGGFPEAYLRRDGERVAARVHEMGLYRQFEASSAKWGANVGKVLVTLAAVSYNFTRWSFEDGDAETPFRITIDDARDFPEYFRFTSEGFIEYAWSKIRPEAPVAVTSERVTPDKVVFTAHPKAASGTVS